MDSGAQTRCRLVCLAVAMCFGCVLHAQPARPVVAPEFRGEAPNIILFLIDDIRDDVLGCAGHPIAHTPVIDALAKRGVRFTNAFVTTPICAASRASILTGLHEHATGYTFGTPPLRYDLCERTYSAVLRRAGYRTALIGKVGVSFAPGARDEMFDEVVSVSRGPYFRPDSEGHLRHVDDITADRAIEFIRDADPRTPFCLSVSFNGTHAEDADQTDQFPYPPSAAGLFLNQRMPEPRLSWEDVRDLTPEFLARSLNRSRFFWRWDTPAKYQINMRNYFRLLAGVDAAIGRVIETLDEQGLADETVVIVTGDNGYYMGERGFAGKWSHYEPSLRVPLIVYDPRGPEARRGATRDELVLNIDLAPTITALGGTDLPVPAGRSLLPLLRGEDTAWRDAFLCEHRWDRPDIPRWEGVRTTRFKYARYDAVTPPHEFLHDLEDDPDELVNLAENPTSRDLLDSMQTKLEALRSGALPQAAGNAVEQPPNVVLIISDDQHYADFGFMGHPHIATPNIDQLAREGVAFTHARVTTSLCCPSLATIITGQYPLRHGITGNTPSTSNPAFGHANQTYIRCIERAETLPELLGQRGYISLQTGKWWHGSAASGGFTVGMTHGDPKRGGRHGDDGLRIGRAGLDPIAEFIDRARSEHRPFFVWYAPFMPHTPHTPPERWLERYRSVAPTEAITKYWAMCSWFDETVGDLRALLSEKGVADDTVILFITDNGWINEPNASRYAPRSKRSPFDGGLRTPIIVHAPGKITPGTSQALACSIDIAPTALALAGIEPGAAMQGINLLDPHAIAERTTLHGIVYSHDAVEYARPDANWEYQWCVNAGWKLILPNLTRFPNREAALYHIADDEDEQVNLAHTHPARVESMTESIRQWIAASR
jgi:arylsulfatase A-like enzyme